MTEIHDSSKSKQIRTLLLVFGTAISAAVVFALVMLHYYGPSGAYLAKNALVDPSNIGAIHFAENNSRSGENSHYVFDRFEFSFFQKAEKQWKKQTIDMQQYADFYTLIGDELSLTSVTDEIVTTFNKGHPASLIVKIRQGNSPQPLVKDLLKVDFAEDSDYFRIQLRETGPLERWAYYHRPDIYQDVMQLFVKSP